MAIIQSQYGFQGNAWTLWPPYDPLTGMAFVSGVDQITHAILSLCLIRKGEDPMHPDFGMAPELFQALSDYDPEYWVYNLETEILNWVAGIDELRVQVSGYNAAQNELLTEIAFTPVQAPTIHVLTWPYYQYQGAVMNGALEPFLSSVRLDGNFFTKLTTTANVS